MSDSKGSGMPEGADGRPGGRWAVLELLPGGALKALSRKQAARAASLPAGCEGCVAGETGLKIREADLADENGPRMKSVNAERATAGELPQRAQPATGER